MRYTNILDAIAFEREDQGSEFEALVTARFVHLLFLPVGFCPSLFDFKLCFSHGAFLAHEGNIILVLVAKKEYPGISPTSY